MQNDDAKFMLVEKIIIFEFYNFPRTWIFVNIK